ncbi:unnamed protein product [Ambrosiozyma monospora]|uniref:Unnamed protein product n=1 Tax=Ambrosiozyma monospora TaxID=43982 RepID=A0ACB5SVY8_AMBMO|nr:unnamed protein product [Ambrosiozyma monospora]
MTNSCFGLGGRSQMPCQNTPNSSSPTPAIPNAASSIPLAHQIPCPKIPMVGSATSGLNQDNVINASQFSLDVPMNSGDGTTGGSYHSLSSIVEQGYTVPVNNNNNFKNNNNIKRG